MKMKKMLAILAALSVLGTTGLTVGAEDATTTEPVTEAITTTETEAETTAAETETETETTVETAATEENQVVGKQIINKGDILTFNGTLSYANGKNRPILNLDTPIEATVGGVDETVTYVRLNEESLTYVDGTKLTVTGTVDLTAFAGTDQNVVFLSNNTITENNATTTTAAETTTTTTTTTTSAADLEAAKKALYEVYAAKYKPAVSGYETVEYHIVDGVLTSATIIVEDQDEKVVKTFFVTKDGATLINSVRMGGMQYGFESTDFTCDGYQFYAQLVRPASDADFRSYLTIYVYDKDGNLSVTNINGLQVGSAVYTKMEDGSFDWAGNSKLKLNDCLSSNGDAITINRSLYEWYNSQDSYTATVDSTTYTYDAATNTFVATNGTNSGTNSGKTDNGSVSNTPASTATKNTSGTPKTGDATTVPAVAVGLTLTAAGVVAFISKRKK